MSGSKGSIKAAVVIGLLIIGCGLILAQGMTRIKLPQIHVQFNESDFVVQGITVSLRPKPVSGILQKSVLARDANGNWTLPNIGAAQYMSQDVYRNGLSQVEGLDYSIAAGAVRFPAGSEADDTIVLKYQVQ